jgi:hypothetical protein
MKITLQTPFLYQNPITGSPSTTTLTCTQLCRLLCPPSTDNAADVSADEAAECASSQAIKTKNTSFINSTTLLLGFDTISRTYDRQGWKTACSVDVLKEACCSWYYESRRDAGRMSLENGSGDAVADDSDVTNGERLGEEIIATDATSTIVEGPVSTRTLSKLYYHHKITGSTRVYPYLSNNIRNSQETQETQNFDDKWEQINQLVNLKMAMETFHETSSFSWPADDDNKDEAVATEASFEAVTTEEHKNINNLHPSVDQMTFDGGDLNDSTTAVTNKSDDKNDNKDEIVEQEQQQHVVDELEAFLSSTDHLAPHASGYDDGDVDEEEYESDGGTRYIRDYQTGNWIHEALMRQRGYVNKNGGGDQRVAAQSNNNATTAEAAATKKRKRKKPKFSAKSARNWVYVTGLPLDTNEDEVSKYFSKVGIIDIDPESLKPKIKLYRHKKQQWQSVEEDCGIAASGELKGDASVCYARPESVDLALQILDENLFRDGAVLSVQRAKFEQHGSKFDTDGSERGVEHGGGGNKRRNISEAKRRVARLAALQAVGWDEGDNGRIAGGLKGLRIIVLMNMFDPHELKHDGDDDDDTQLHALEREIYTECEEIGSVEKITIFSKHPAGVVIVKFVKPNAATNAVNAFNGKVRGNGRKVEASFWDGTTDYTVVDVEKEEKETEKRLDKFGDWLEEQELPEEFQLKVEKED